MLYFLARCSKSLLLFFWFVFFSHQAWGLKRNLKKKKSVLDCKWQKIIAIGVFVRRGKLIRTCVARLGVQHSPAVPSVGGWDRNRDSIPFLSNPEMRVFHWMPRRSLISRGDARLSPSPSCLPAHSHTVSDTLTFPDRHLSPSLCGCESLHSAATFLPFFFPEEQQRRWRPPHILCRAAGHG